MVLHQAIAKSLDKRAAAIHKELSEMNAKCVTCQKAFQLQKIKEKIAKKQKNADYILKLIQTCKTWSGPCCSVGELKDVLKKHPDNEKRVIKIELSFYIHTHKADRLGRPELFRLAGIDTTTMLENLIILLANEDNSASRISVAEVALPTNEDVLTKVLLFAHSNLKDIDHPVYEVNELCVNVWNEGENINWHIGCFKSAKEDHVYEVEQLVRVDECSHLQWVHSTKPLIEELDSDQVLRFKNGKRHTVEGKWNLERLNKFTLKTLMLFLTLLKIFN